MITLSSAMDEYNKRTNKVSNKQSTSSSSSNNVNLQSALSDLSTRTGKDYITSYEIPQVITDDDNLQQKAGIWNTITNWVSNIFQSPEDSNIPSVAWNTAKTALTSTAEGFLNTVEGIADFGQYAVSDVLDFFGATRAAESVKENAQFNSTAAIFGKNDPLAGNLFNTGWKEELDRKGILGSSGRQLAEGVGNVAALAGASYLGTQIVGGALPETMKPLQDTLLKSYPKFKGTELGEAKLAEIVASSLGSYASAYGGARTRALNEGYSDSDSRKAGVINGIAEAISEQFFNGMTGLRTAGVGETILKRKMSDATKQSVKKFFNTKTGKIISVILDGLEEGSEEIISNILTTTGNDIAYMLDPEYQAYRMDGLTGDWLQDVGTQLNSSESWDAFMSAFLTSAFLGGSNTILTKSQEKEIIQSLAEDTNSTYEETQARIDAEMQKQGVDERTIEKQLYSDVKTNMTIEEINSIDNLDDAYDLLEQLNEAMTQPRDINTLTPEFFKEFDEKIGAVESLIKDLDKKLSEPEKTDSFKEQMNKVEESLQKPTDTPEVTQAKVEALNVAAETIDNESDVIKVGENVKDVRVRYNQVEQEAIDYINNLNQDRVSKGETPITIIEKNTQNQLRVMEALEAFGRHVIFARDLPGSFVTARDTAGNNLSSVLFINDKINTGLLAKSSVTNKNQAMLYAVGHEMFHSLKMAEPEVYTEFVNYVAGNIDTDQILKFMDMYDPEYILGLIPAMQIDGKFNIEEVLAHPKKYATQYQALMTIAEEMTANEFGGMFTDIEYMTKLSQAKPNLFNKIVEIIRKFFKDINRPIYNSPLTQLQIETIRNKYEETITGVKTEQLKSKTEQTESKTDVQKEQKVEAKRQAAKTTKSTRQETVKTEWKDVAEAYMKANTGEGSVETARELYDKFVSEGGKQDAGFEKALDGLKNTVKTDDSTRQKEEKITKKVNTSEQIEKPTRKTLTKETQKETKLPTKKRNLDKLLDKALEENDAYFAFEEVIEKNKLSDEEIEDLREKALEKADSEEIKDSLRNWTPEIMQQEQAEIEELSNRAEINDSVKSVTAQEDEKPKKEKVEKPKKETQPVLPKKEVKVEPKYDSEVKTTKQDMTEWFKRVEKMYDTYEKSNPSDKAKRKKSVTTAYASYRQQGGSQLIEELEQEYLKNIYMDSNGEIKLLPTIDENFDIEEYRNSEERKQYNKEQKAQGRTESKFFSNTVFKSPILQSVVSRLKNNPTFTHYIATTNHQLINEAIDRIDNEGFDNEYDRLLNKRLNGDLLNASELSEAAMIISYYNEEGNNSIKADTLAGQLTQSVSSTGLTLQAVKTIQSLDPSLRVRVMGNQLETAINNLEKNGSKSQKDWAKKELARIEKDGSIFSDGEKRYITQMYKEMQKYDPDSYESKLRDKMIQRYLDMKIPHSWSRKLKDFRRLAMLANPKTWARNDFANLAALPVNIASKGLGSLVDKWATNTFGTSRTTTGVTTGALKAGAKGFTQGLAQNKLDFRTGTEYENIADDSTTIGKALNWANRFTAYAMGVDKAYREAYRSFNEATTVDNSEVSQDARAEYSDEYANQNVYTRRGKTSKIVQQAQSALNAVHIGDLGLGDIVIPFLTTPANIAAAVYYYSPAALGTLYKQGKALQEAVNNKESADTIFTLQHRFADTAGRIGAGTALYMIAYTIAKAGFTTGDEPEDKDLAAALAEQGWQKYSIKLNDGTYMSYDWVEPFSMPFAVMSDVINKKDSNMLDTIFTAFKIGGARLQDQSFLYGLQTLFSAENPVEGVVQTLSGLPASFVPTAFKQVADIIDPTAKSTYDSGSVLKTMFNQTIAKIPGAKSLLPTKKNTLGEDVLKYSENKDGLSLLWNTLQSAWLPGNVNTASNQSYITDEIMDVYNHTGVATVMPQVASRTFNYDSDGDGQTEKYVLSLTEKNKLQEMMGNITTNAMEQLMMSDVYNMATYEQKATALTSLVQYAKAKALQESGYVPNYQIKSGNAAQINNYVNQGLSVGEAVMYDGIISDIKAIYDTNGNKIDGSQNGSRAYAIMNMPISDTSKDIMLHLISPNSKTPETTESLGNLKTQDEFISYYSLDRHDSFAMNKFSRDDLDTAKNYYNFDTVDFAKYANDLSNIKSDKDANGNTITNSKKNNIINYINTLPLNTIQKIYLYKISGYSVKQWQNELYDYINGLNVSASEKEKLWQELGF